MSATTSASGIGAASAVSILRFPAVKALTGLSRTSIHRLVKAGNFPPPRRLGVRAVGWLSSDLERWQAERPSASAGGRP